MIRWIINSSLQFRFLVIALAVVLITYGVSEIRGASVDVYPEFDPPLVEVQTEALGLSAAEMEALITVPLEADLLNGVAWLDQIYSESVSGMSSILLVFEPGTDPIKARQMVQERLTQTFALPNVSKPPTMLQPLSTTNRVMIVGLSSQDLSLIEMSVLARWNIVPRLMGVSGVANVAIWGHRDWQLQVQVDPESLHDQGVTLQQVIKTTGEALWVSPLSFLEASTPGTAGWIETPNQRLGIRHLLPISSPESLAKVSLVDGEGLVLGDVANIVEDHQPLIGDAYTGGGPGLLLVVEKFPEANVVEVTKGVDDALDAMRPGLSGIEIDNTVFRPVTYIEHAVDNLTIALLIGAILVIIALGILFYDWRTVLLCAVVIPVSLLTAAFVLQARGAPFNMMILAGLAIAVLTVVDDVILDVESIRRRFRQIREADSEKTTTTIVFESLVEARSTLMFSRLIILLAVLPVFFIGGLSGSFLEPFAVAYVVAILTSLAVALILTPALSLILFTDAKQERPEPQIRQWLQRHYQALMSRIIRTPNWALLLVVVVAIIGLAIVPLLDHKFVPSLKQTDLLIEVDAAPGTSRSEMNRVLTLASQELRSTEGVRNVGFHIGRAVTGDQVVGINTGEIWISLDPSTNYDDALATVRDTIDGYPGLSARVQTYQPENVDEALTGADEDIVVRLYGHEFVVLGAQAQEVRDDLLKIDGVDEAQIAFVPEQPQVEIETNLAKAEAYGLKPGDVRRAAATLLAGLDVGSLYQDQKVFSVVVWGVPEIRDSLSDVSNLMIGTPSGDLVRLGDVAEVRIAPSPTVIQRDAVSRFLDINVSVSGRRVASVANDIDDYLGQRTFPIEYHAEVQGNFADRQATQLRVLGIAIGVILGAFLLLQAAFGSWSLAFIAIVTLPIGLVGGVIAVLLSGGDLSLGAAFGFLGLTGIAVRNGVTLTARFQRLQRDEDAALEPELVLRGASIQLVPILMTALVPGLAFLPVAVAGNMAGFEVLHPMAIVVWGGLITSTVLALFIWPTLYLRFGPRTLSSESSLYVDEAQQQPAHG
jgi:CzcA family heavy metal efflux pump